MSTITQPRPAVNAKSSRKPLDVELTIRINGQLYDVTPLAPAPGSTKAYRLVKVGDADSVYDVEQTAAGLVECNCPSYEKTYRGNGLESCKHGRASIMVGLCDYPSVAEVLDVPSGHTMEAASAVTPPAFDRTPYRAQNAVAEGRALWLSHRHLHTSEPLPAPCCDPVEPMPCSACVNVHTLPDDLSGDDWQDEYRWELGSDPEPETDREVLDLIESGATEQAYGEAPLAYATPDVFRAVAEGRAEFAREFGYVPTPGHETREYAETYVVDNAIAEGWAEYRDKAGAEAMRARRLAGELAEDAPARTLAEQVDDHARELRAQGSPLGDLLAERAESLAAEMRYLDASTVGQYRDRREAALDAARDAAEARHAARCC